MSSLSHFQGIQLLEVAQKITSFVCTNRINLLHLIIVAKGLLKFSMLMLIKQNSLSLLRNLAHLTFGDLLIALSTNVNLLYGPKVLFSASDKVKLFAENFSKNSNFDDSDMYRTNLKMRNITVTPKLVKKVITNLDSSKACCPDYILVVVLKNCEPELSYILAELFNMCLFPDFWKVEGLIGGSCI